MNEQFVRVVVGVCHFGYKEHHHRYHRIFVSSCMIELAGVDIQLFQKLAWEIPVFKEKRVVA